jgi:alanine racemase
MALRVIARVNLAAIERNVARLLAETGPAQLCAVVKADGYGHGAVPAARAALAGGATWLAVATAEEARRLRAAGLDEVPILVLGALSREELAVALDADADVVAWTPQLLADLRADGRPARVHVKLDTGMGRLGTRDAEEATRLADELAADDTLRLAGLMTHFATADERGDQFFGEQLDRFRAWVEPLRARHPNVLVHAANSAAALREPGARFDLVRCGIAIYGMDPFGEAPSARDLEPALELLSYVAAVKTCDAGESTGYGRRFVAQHPTTLATIPVGYGDGWRRALTNNCDLLLHGRRVPLVGTVSMDNVTVDVGDHGRPAEVGDGVVLIGAQGAEQITAEEVARRIGTINYEVTCGLTGRVPREHHRDGEVVDG